MRAEKVNFTIPHEIATQLKAAVGERRRSAFVARAIQEKLRELEQEQLAAELAEGYKARSAEDAGLASEWEQATIESWPER